MELTAEEAWARILESARAKLPEQGFRTWLAPTTAVALSRDRLVVAAPSDFAVEWIEDKYGELLVGLARGVFGESFSVSFEARANGDQTSPAFPPVGQLEEFTEPGPGAAVEREARAPVIGKLNPRYTLGRFVVGSNNELCAAACRAVADAPGRAYNPLFIYGGVGLGKTHLMHAIGHAARERFPDHRIAYVPTEQFTNELIAAIQGRTTARFHNRYRSIDVLLIDDVHFLAGKERTQEEFFHTFNSLYDAQKQIVLTSDRLPKEIAGLQERLVSRFEWGLVADVQPPDFETRLAILHMKMSEDGLSMPEDVLAFIAGRCRSSVRELEGALIKLLAYSSLTRREMCRALALEVLGAGSPSARGLSPADVEDAVAGEFGVPVALLRSRSRSREATLPRQVAMYLLKAMLDLPYTHIGRHFGGRDHSTVMHSIRKVEERAARDDAFRSRISAIRAGLE